MTSPPLYAQVKTMKTQLLLMRHGETVENSLHILQGQSEGRLSAKGIDQVRHAAQRLAALADDERPELIIASDLGRCKHTAALVSESLPIPIIYSPLLRERDWGSLTGTSIAEAQKMGGNFPPDVESVETVCARGIAFMQQVAGQYATTRILVVTHGLFARCLQAAMLGCTVREVAPMLNAEVRPLRVSLDHIAGQGDTKTETGAAAE